MGEGEETWNLMVDSKCERGGNGGGDNGIGAEDLSRCSTAAATPSSTREESRMVWDLRPGAGYRFKARARTVFGWSPVGSATAVYNTARRF